MSEPGLGASPTGRDECGRHADRQPADDAEMMRRVRAAGPDSAEAHFLREALLDYARGRITWLHKTNQLLAQVESMLPIRLPAPPDDWQDSAAGLVYESVQHSLEPFFASAVFGTGKSRWHVHGGASIGTYFLNKCLMTFKDFYLKEYANRGPGEVLCAEVGGDHELSAQFLHLHAPDDPEARAVHADEVRRAGQKMTPEEARTVLERFSGKTYEEIGRDHGKSDQAVSSSVQRLRHRIGC